MAEPRAQGGGRWFAPALAIVGMVTALRVALLALNRTDLFVDEAQYWFWGQELAFGYFSKPPLIAWVIRAVTEMAGSDAAFWVRLPGPLFHGATAMILASIGARLYGGVSAIVVAAAYATLPMVALGSLLISTDTIMFPFLALALALYLRLIGRVAVGGAFVALGVGVALGLAFLAKYAALYFLGLGALAAIVSPGLRPRLAEGALILAAFAASIAPNILWNLANGLTTLSHTSDNIGWLRNGAGLNLAGLAEFFAAQFAVFGPVLFGTLLTAGLARLRGRAGAEHGILLWLSLPIIAIVCAQAVLSKAYANWAAAAYLAGTLVAVPWLMRRPRMLRASFVVNGALCLALPLATVFADRLRIGGDLVLGRYLDRAATSARLIEAAHDAGASAIVADNRDILADLFHSGRDSGISVFAWPLDGPPAHHYAQKHPFAGETRGTVLVVSLSGAKPPCEAGKSPARTFTAGEGAYEGHQFALYQVPTDCWKAP